jgi:putative transposase
MQAIADHGKPEIINSDKGSQNTSERWSKTLQGLGICISMDSEGRASGNTFIERWFRTIKYKHIYLYPSDNGLELHAGIHSFVEKYHRRR